MTTRLQRRIDFAQQRFEKVQFLRFSTGLLFFVLFLIGGFIKSPELLIASFVYWFLVFPFLVHAVRKANLFKGMLQAKKAFLEKQNQKKNAKILSQFNGPVSEESRELLLIGPYSLFTYLNETWTKEAEDKLKDNIDQLEQNVEVIKDTQASVKELSRYSHVLEKILFRYMASENEKISLSKVESELNTLPSKTFLTWSVIGIAVWVLAVLVSVLSVFKIIDQAFLNIWFLYLAIVVIAYNKYGSFFFKSLGLYSTLRVLKHLLRVLDHNEQAIFKKVLPHIYKAKPHKDFKKIEWIMSFLSVETHILVNIVVNLISPYYLLVGGLFVYRTNKIKRGFPKFKDEIVHLDYLSNLVYLYTYHTKTFPTFHNERKIVAVEMFIPLIAHHKVQKNSIVLDDKKSLHVLMGSNMSGKSTFLRTLAINQTLAQLGGPVFAKSYSTFITRIQSCILIEDSIEDNISYFMKEVKRLKKIFFNVKEQENTLFLIDELFKGTNPKERLIAATSYLTEIAKFHGLGIVTTHDPEIGFLEKDNSKFKSWHMEDHCLKEGPAVSTNALKILRSEGLPVFEN